METEKGRNDEGRMTNDKGNVVKISSFIHTPLLRGTYPAVAGYLQRGNCSDGKGEYRDGKSIEDFPKEWGCSDVFFCLSIIENELFAIFG